MPDNGSNHPVIGRNKRAFPADLKVTLHSMSSEFDGSISDKLVRQVIMDAFDIQIRQYQRYKKNNEGKVGNR